MSRRSLRFLATFFVFAQVTALGSASARAASPLPDSTWTQLGTLPEKLDSAVLAMAVDPNSGGTLLVGTQAGSIYRSTDYGQSWKQVRRDLGRGVLTLGYNPFKRDVVMAGTRGSGAWKSGDGGQTWGPVAGATTSSVRGFGFAKSLTAAGTDRGVVAGTDNAAWTPIGLDKVRVSALAVAAMNDPVKLVAGGDTTAGGEALPLFSSLDGARTWTPAPGAIGGSSMVASLAASPLGPKSDSRALLLGTNTGLFVSNDNAASWQPLTGGGVLPATDFTSEAFVTTHLDRFYVASDGGGSDRGGVWFSSDGGQHFSSLASPLPSVTALAVSNEEQPTLYTATFRPSDHAVILWGLHDLGAPAQQSTAGLPPPASAGTGVAGGASKAPTAVATAWLQELLAGPEAPYLALGMAAIAVLLLAGIAYFRRGRGF